jgi:hypothetical protein
MAVAMVLARYVMSEELSPTDVNIGSKENSNIILSTEMLVMTIGSATVLE